MKQDNKTDSSIDAETNSFFERILRPSVLEEIHPLNSIVAQNYLKEFNQLWNLIKESNLLHLALLVSSTVLLSSWSFLFSLFSSMDSCSLVFTNSTCAASINSASRNSRERSWRRRTGDG